MISLSQTAPFKKGGRIVFLELNGTVKVHMFSESNSALLKHVILA